MKNIKAVFKREFKAYFDSPVAYVFLTAFLVLAGFLTFGVAMFFERRQADLTPFFFWHPWVYLLLVPAATMGVWADERRNGTAELLLTLPVTITEVLVGKFLAAWSFVGIGLALTFPVALTAGYLGSPDWGAVFCGYLGSLLLSGAAVAIGVFASTLSRSSVVGFVVSLALVFLLLIIGFDPVIGAVAAWGVPTAITDSVASCSLLSHFEAMRKGVVDFADIGYYFAMMVFMLAAAKTVTDGRRGASKGVVGLGLVGAIAASSVVILANLPLRCDMTAENLYTLSKGSKAVLGQLTEDVTLKYYVSSSSAEMPMALKTYAQQVGNLLKEYERAGGGRLVVEEYDPKPDSDAEEWAQRYGVEPQTGGNPFGQGIYFGVVAVCGDREETLGVLSPRTESTLEYDLTRLVTRVAWPERPVVGVMTSLPDVLGGQMNPMMMQMGQRPPQGWAAFSELAKDYDVRTVEPDAEKIDDDIKTLVMVHAKNLSDKTLYAIDQFVLRGGKLVACVDPFSIKDMQSSRSQQNPMMGQMGGDGPSTLGKLFDAWGVKFEEGKISCDLEAATKLNNGQGGVESNPAFLSLGTANMDKGDLIVADLTNVMFPFAGAFTFEKKDMDISFEPVITTSKDNSCSTDKMSMQYGGMKDMVPDGKERILAARLSGTFKTAFPKGPDGTNDVSKALAEGKGNVLLFADSDFLADDFCVRMMRTPFGSIPQLINENLTLFSNAMEQFAGREELIGVRSRGASDRPFTVVNELEAEATKKWQAKEAEFQEELQQTQQRLSALQKEKKGGERFILSKEQQDEIVKLRKSQAETRKQLKNVRKELTADIDSLGLRLKIINIALVPVLVVLFGLLRGYLRRKRA
ncbi:MAG: Gldg family protein [Kiritimatiellae bacterium]|nr:Gldg family protein [Kiritimatiellia bacterium]